MLSPNFPQGLNRKVLGNRFRPPIWHTQYVDWRCHPASDFDNRKHHVKISGCHFLSGGLCHLMKWDELLRGREQE